MFFYELIGQTDFKDVALLGNGTHSFDVWPRVKIRLAPNDTLGKPFRDEKISIFLKIKT